MRYTEEHSNKIKKAGTCQWEDHLPALTYSFWFKRRFWLRCWKPECNLKCGPFTSQKGAQQWAHTSRLGMAGPLPTGPRS